MGGMRGLAFLIISNFSNLWLVIKCSNYNNNTAKNDLASERIPLIPLERRETSIWKLTVCSLLHYILIEIKKKNKKSKCKCKFYCFLASFFLSIHRDEIIKVGSSFYCPA